MPIGLTMIFEAMLFNAATLIMGTFGTASVAAHQIALNVPSITFMVPLGIGMAATVRVGLAAGAGDREGVRRAGYTALIMGVGFMSTAAVLHLDCFPQRDRGSLFRANARANADVIALAVVFLRVAAAFQIFDGLAGGGRAVLARPEGCARADVDRRGQLLARRLSPLPSAGLHLGDEGLGHLDRLGVRAPGGGHRHVHPLLFPIPGPLNT